jgi:hypothetical protein
MDNTKPLTTADAQGHEDKQPSHRETGAMGEKKVGSGLDQPQIQPHRCGCVVQRRDFLEPHPTAKETAWRRLGLCLGAIPLAWPICLIVHDKTSWGNDGSSTGERGGNADLDGGPSIALV